MILAVTVDFHYDTGSIKREGIWRFCTFLFDALLKNNDKLKIEFWNYSINTDNVLDCFGILKEQYPERVFFYNENLITEEYKKKLPFKDYFHFLIKKRLYKILFFLSRNKKMHNKYIKYKLYMHTLTHYVDLGLETRIIKAVRQKSKAKVVYIPFPILTLGKNFKCKKIIAIHDLFTIAYRNLFKDTVYDIIRHNKEILSNLNDYAEKNAIFVSTSDYIAQNHSLRYVRKLKPENIAVIPFPSMMKDFSNLNTLSKEDFKQKYGIVGKYIPYPTQNRPNKNLIVLLKALKILKDKGIKIKFVTTGRLDSVKETNKFIKNNNLKNEVIELGSVSEEDLYALYKYSDMVVITTIIEGLGISGQSLEVLKIGNIPVIHAKSLGIEDSLKSVGLSFETADLNWFNINDYKTLAQKIEDVLTNPPAHVEKQKHIIQAYTKLTWDDVAQKYIKLFDK